jgi:hypothetical protein
MIELFDDVLRRLITTEVADGAGVEISFEAPTREWGTKRSVPTLDLYLYDVREDLTRREVQWVEVRDANGRVVGRRPPPRRYRLSYLVTAWTQRPEDEHRLLSACLGTFLRHETLPPPDLAGALVDQPIPVELEVALPPGPDRSLADVWTALGGELKPSLDLVATVPFVVGRESKAGKPVLDELWLNVVRADQPKGQPEIAHRNRAATGIGDAAAGDPGTPGAPEPPDRTLRMRRTAGA